MREVYEHPAAMEPLFPEDREGKLTELAAGLIARSARLGASAHPITRETIEGLVRTMNSYYSNLIEGHNTHPADIQRAMSKDYSSDPAKRALQIESRAHVEVQLLIEKRLRESPETDICSADFLRWIHKELYERFPSEFLVVKSAQSREDRVEPGRLRTCEVEVGRHIAPASRSLTKFLDRFREAYSPSTLDPIRRLIASAASHHRLAWIHPFLDGNGRVARFFTHAYLVKTGCDGHGLWTVTRGLARRRDDYMLALAQADQSRLNDLDGRGNLSDEGLRGFCAFFLETAVDQADFMARLLDMDSMQHRISVFAERWAAMSGLPIEIAALLRDVFLRGEIPRGEAARILGKPERTARRLVSRLTNEGLLLSAAPGRPLRFGIPMQAMGYYFPRLYPEGMEFE